MQFDKNGEEKTPKGNVRYKAPTEPAAERSGPVLDSSPPL